MAFNKSKYSNKWTEVDGIKFQSKLEADELLSNLVYGIRPRSCLIDPVLVRRP
jgi:hypothetical protein